MIPEERNDVPNLERPFGQWWQVDEPMVMASPSALRRFGTAVLQQAGATEDDALFVFETFLEKSEQGDHTRGLDNFPPLVREALRGNVDMHPAIETVRESAGTALLDGGPTAMNTLVCRAAMDMAVHKARSCGIGMVGVRCTVGILTPHVRQAVEAGMVGVAMTQSYPTVAPFGGMLPMLGNAPVAVGIPAHDHDPVILDLSLTQSSSSGVKLAATQGQPAPPGLVLDANGNPTTDASALMAPGFSSHDRQQSHGSLAPLGNSHKGYGLVFVVGLLSSVLTETDFPWEGRGVARGVPGEGSRYGALLAAIDPTRFAVGDFAPRVDAFIDTLKGSSVKEGTDEILYPGEKSQRLRRHREQVDSFAMPASHYALLLALADEQDLIHLLPDAQPLR